MGRSAGLGSNLPIRLSKSKGELVFAFLEQFASMLTIPFAVGASSVSGTVLVPSTVSADKLTETHKEG